MIEEDGAIIIDVTPDFRAQMRLLSDRCDVRLSGIFLTHAHWGHYGGLPLLGKESWNVDSLPVYCSRRFYRFLTNNEPFATLFQSGNLVWKELLNEQTSDWGLTPIEVPHRDEFSETFAFIFNLNGRKTLYMPDVDFIDDRINDLIRSVDLAFIDGTFYDDLELQHRDPSQIPHPRIRETVQTLGDISNRIVFTHLNHTNPGLKRNSDLRKEIEGLGFRIASDGDEFV